MRQIIMVSSHIIDVQQAQNNILVCRKIGNNESVGCTCEGYTLYMQGVYLSS